MDISSIQKFPAETAADFDRLGELKVFDESKAGVKGLIDAGVVEIPKIFVRPPNELAEESKISRTHLKVPSIDLTDINRGDRHKEIVNEVRRASENWGFFLVVNHGVPLSLLNDMIDGIRKFHEQDVEVKKEFHTRDRTKRVKFNSNYDLYQSRAANWRDTLNISLRVSYHLDPDELPAACRDATIEYIKNVTKLGDTLFELLSEALGLKSDHLKALECARGRSFAGHYYPACPEPELTMGISSHTDPNFLTILLQDHIGGLQVRHGNQWVDVPSTAGALVVNIGDHLQIISNDKFKSVDHRVLANRVGPRISVALFFTGVTLPAKIYGPIKDLLSEESPPVYKDFSVGDYMAKYHKRPLDDKSGLDLSKVVES